MPKDLKNLTLSERQMMARQRAAVLENFNADERTATLSFASEVPVMDWWGEAEILRCNDESMDIARFTNGVMPLLFNHNRNAVIGRPTKLWNENGKAYAEIQFDDDDESKRIMKKVESGSLRGVSVGYRVKEWRIIKKGEKSADGIEGPAWIAERWEVFEISIVSIPADTSVGVGRSLIYDEEMLNNGIRTIEEGEENMPKQGTLVPTPEEERQVTPGEAIKTPEEVTASANERAVKINAICKQFGVEDAKRDAWIGENKSIEDVNAEVLSILAERSKPAPTLTPKITVGADRKEEKRAVYRDAVLLRSGIALANPNADAEKYRHMSMMDIARDMLRDNDERSVMELNPNELFKRAITTTALPTLLNDVTTAALVEGYKAADVTYDKWAHIGSVSDFREHRLVKVGMGDEPVEIPENGEFTAINLKETTAGVKIKTYGAKYAYTRQSFVNDDKNVLTEIPYMLGRKYPILINRMAYKALTSANITAGTAAAISTASLAEAMKVLRMVQDPKSKEYLRIRPKYLVVPVSQEAVAAQFLRSVADPSANHSGVANIYNGALQLITDPELDSASTTAWYVMGEPVYGEGIEVDFLNGNKTPFIESQVSFDTLGWEYRSYLDFGVKLLSTLGYVKNQGVAAQG